MASLNFHSAKQLKQAHRPGPPALSCQLSEMPAQFPLCSPSWPHGLQPEELCKITYFPFESFT